MSHFDIKSCLGECSSADSRVIHADCDAALTALTDFHRCVMTSLCGDMQSLLYCFFLIFSVCAGLFSGVQDDQLYTSNRGHCVTRSCAGVMHCGGNVST